MQPRSRHQRKADALATLYTPAVDGWVASASAAGDPHLVPLSLLWTGDRVVIALQESSVTARNIIGSGSARVGVGPTRDVVMIDTRLDRVHAVAEAPGDLAEAYARQADWDPRTSGDGLVYLVLRPVRVQAWREADEIAGRTLMRDGDWLV